MKSNTHSITTFVRNVFLVSAITILSAISVHAQKPADTSNPAASVSYLGSANEQMSFGLKYESETGEKYAITILDSDGYILFDGVFSEKKFNKTFKVSAEIGNLTFVISNPRNRSDKKFQVTTEKRMIEEVYVHAN